MRAGNGFSIHFIRQDDISKRVDAFLERDGAAVHVANFVGVITGETDGGRLRRSGLFAQRNRVDIHTYENMVTTRVVGA
jgi:hypothetical protein